MGPAVLQNWAADVIAILRDALADVEEARARGDTALDQKRLDDLLERYDTAAAFGRTHNRLRDWDTGNHPGYALGCWLRKSATASLPVHPQLRREPDEQYLRTLRESSETAPGRSGYWHSLATLAHWCRLRSYLGSADAHGIIALDAIASAITSKPWLPPLPAIN